MKAHGIEFPTDPDSPDPFAAQDPPVRLPDFPGIDPDLLRGRNFQGAIRKLGYESFRFEGDGMYVTCYLWKRDEDTASIQYRSSNIEMAAAGALAAARAIAEM